MEELTIGSTFAGRYEITELLGSGGMGKVYKVLDKKLGEVIAVKLLKKEIASDGRMIERFRNELKLARKITHRNVCRMHDLNEEGGTHYITMEYVPGETLKKLIKTKIQMSAEETIHIAKQICEGLVEAHRLGVVHRDLKPQNIMIDEEGNAKIMDFGIARSLEVEGRTETGFVVGTPEYMSPEQIEAKEIDQRSDIYSLGIILYEMLTGKVPFSGETPISIAIKHKMEAPPDPRTMNDRISEDLSHVMLKCMEKDRRDRYQSADALLSALSNVERGVSTIKAELEEKDTLTSIARMSFPRLKRIIVRVSESKRTNQLVAVLVAIAVISVIAWLLIPPPPVSGNSIACIYFVNKTGDENLDYLSKALSDLLIADLSQSRYLIVLSEENVYNILKQTNQLGAKKYLSEALRKISNKADKKNIENLLLGDYSREGDTFSITIALQDTKTGKRQKSITVNGIGERSIFSMVDELTKRIKKEFNLTDMEIASDFDKQVAEIRTSSPEAFKYYSEGRRYGMNQDYEQSIELMRKAVEMDPMFAMAYRTMAMSYSNRGNAAEKRNNLQKAMAFSYRASEKEQYLISGDFYALSEKTYDKAIEAYVKLLELSPLDDYGNNRLAKLYKALEQWDIAIAQFETLRKNKKTSLTTYTNLSDVYKEKGEFDKAQGVLEDYLKEDPDNAIIHGYLALNYLSQNKYETALIEIEKAYSLDPEYTHYHWIKGDIYRCKGDLMSAEDEYKKLLESKERSDHIRGKDSLASLYLLQAQFEKSKDEIEQGIKLAETSQDQKSSFLLELAYICLRLGKPAEALKICDKVWKDALEEENLSKEREALFCKGLIYLTMNAMNEAVKVNEDLKKCIKKGINQKNMRYYYCLMGMIDCKKNNLDKAVESYNEYLSLVSSQYVPMNEHCLFIDSLASAYYRSSELKKAEEEWGKIALMRTVPYCYGDVFAKSFYWLAKTYQKQGLKGKAIEHYEKFLALWKEASPAIPEKRDADRQLKSLKM